MTPTPQPPNSGQQFPLTWRWGDPEQHELWELFLRHIALLEAESGSIGQTRAARYLSGDTDRAVSLST